MKRMGAALTVCAAIGLVAWLGLTGLKMTAERREVDLRRSRIPDIRLESVRDESDRLHRDRARSTLLVFYTTTCEYCRAELIGFRRRAAEFKGSDVVLISPEDPDRTLAFRREIGLDRIAQLHTYRDANASLARRLEIRRVPTVLVYGSDGLLTRAFEGLTPIDTILDAAKYGRFDSAESGRPDAAETERPDTTESDESDAVGSDGLDAMGSDGSDAAESDGLDAVVSGQSDPVETER